MFPALPVLFNRSSNRSSLVQESVNTGQLSSDRQEERSTPIKTRKRKLIIALAIAAIASFALGLNALNAVFQPEASAAEPSVVATVEGRQIPANIYRMYLKNGIQALGLDEKTPEGRRGIEQLKEGIVSDLIDRALIEAEATRRELAISDSSFAEAYQKTIAEMGGDQRYQAYLSEHRLTDQDFRPTIVQELCGQLLRAELGKGVSVAESDIQEFYNKERDNSRFADVFKEPERVRARHILVDARPSRIAREINSAATLSEAEVERRVTDEMAKRRRRAASILEKLKRGADLRRLAAEYSDDAGTKHRGGDLGLFTRHSHTARFDDAAFRLKPGRLSDIVETEYGYHIISVTEHKPERALSLYEARPAIHARLLAAKQAAHLKAWLESLRNEANIQINPFYRTGSTSRYQESIN